VRLNENSDIDENNEDAVVAWAPRAYLVRHIVTDIMEY
jgi:hypothetical protein